MGSGVFMRVLFVCCLSQGLGLWVLDVEVSGGKFLTNPYVSEVAADYNPNEQQKLKYFARCLTNNSWRMAFSAAALATLVPHSLERCH